METITAIENNANAITKRATFRSATVGKMKFPLDPVGSMLIIDRTMTIMNIATIKFFRSIRELEF